MSTPPQQTTNQETAARGSYISVAASITAKFKCCNTDSSDRNTAITHNTDTGLHNIVKSTSAVSEDLPIREDDTPTE